MGRIVVDQQTFDAVVNSYPLHPFPPTWVRRLVTRMVFKVGEEKRPS